MLRNDSYTLSYGFEHGNVSQIPRGSAVYLFKSIYAIVLDKKAGSLRIVKDCGRRIERSVRYDEAIR